MSAIHAAFHLPAHHAGDVGLGKRVLGLLEIVERWGDRARQRRALRDLPDYALTDIALSRADVDAESSKPFWRA